MRKTVIKPSFTTCVGGGGMGREKVRVSWRTREVAGAQPGSQTDLVHFVFMRGLYDGVHNICCHEDRKSKRSQLAEHEANCH